MKACSCCKLVKSLDDFQVRRASADGRTASCRACLSERDKLRANEPHRVAARGAYQKTGAYANSHSASVSRWTAKHPDRRKAAVTLNNAVRDGRLRQQPCHICGSKAVAHHPDYSRPLDVVWLCQPHHKQAHALVTNAPVLNGAPA